MIRALTRDQDDDELPILVEETLEEVDGRCRILHVVQHLSMFTTDNELVTRVIQSPIIVPR